MMAVRLALLLGFLSTLGALAPGGDCCDRCGGCQQLRKICRPVCETKEVKEIQWDVQCEDFCVPGPSQCVKGCKECGQAAKRWIPNCGSVRTRKKLVQKEVTKQVPTVRWVVETVCCECGE